MFPYIIMNINNRYPAAPPKISLTILSTFDVFSPSKLS